MKAKNRSCSMSLVARVRKAIRKIEESVKEFDNSILSHRWYNKGFEEYVEKPVRRHMRILEEGRGLPQREREKNQLYALIRKDYKDHYCPPHLFHDWLNKENRERYFWLRLEIDQVLDDSGIFNK